MASPKMVGGTSQAVTGATQFSAALRRMAPAVKRNLDKQNRTIGKLVVERGKAKASGVSPQAAAAARSLSATASGGGVGIRLGSGVPFALGAEFGAKKYPQFMAWTGNQWSGVPSDVGYFMHPAIRDSMPEVVDKYLEAAQDAARSAGLRFTPSRAGALDIARSSTTL